MCNREITLIRSIRLDTLDDSCVKWKIARVCIHFLCCVKHKEMAAILLNNIAENVMCFLNLFEGFVNVCIGIKIVLSICRNKEAVMENK